MAPTLPATEALSVGGPSLPPPAPEGWPVPYFLFALAPCLWVQTRRTNPARCLLPPFSPQHGQAGRPRTSRSVAFGGTGTLGANPHISMWPQATT